LVIFYHIYHIFTIILRISLFSTALLPSSAPKVLGLQPGASSAAVRRAYHCLALLHHPDKGGEMEMGSQNLSVLVRTSKKRSYGMGLEKMRAFFGILMGRPWDFGNQNMHLTIRNGI
jgi:hypothetical protein